MSYSVCKQCNNMVSCYEKYCDECLAKIPSAIQVQDYWARTKDERDRLDKIEMEKYSKGES